MRNSLVVALFVLIAAPVQAERGSYFGHIITIAGGKDDEKKVFVDGKAVGSANEIRIDQTETIAGVGVVILSLDPGGNACNGDKLVVSFPKNKPFRADSIVGDCSLIETTVHEKEIVFSIDAGPSQAGSRWIWTPERGAGTKTKVPYQTDPGKTWDNLRASQPSHPADLFKFADIGQQLRDLIGGDFDEAITIIDGTGSAEFDGDYFVGTSSAAHMADDTGSLIVADPRTRRVFVAWKAEGKKIVVRPEVKEWPEGPRRFLKDWSEPWYKSQ